MLGAFWASGGLRGSLQGTDIVIPLIPASFPDFGLRGQLSGPGAVRTLSGTKNRPRGRGRGQQLWGPTD